MVIDNPIDEPVIASGALVDAARYRLVSTAFPFCYLEGWKILGNRPCKNFPIGLYVRKIGVGYFQG